MVWENDVNEAAVLLDYDVTFADAEDNFDGGALTVSGLLAEDVLGVRNVGAGAGEIGLTGANVTFGGTVIGVGPAGRARP